MKLVTQDYGCGTSSSILDYKINDVISVSETEYEHVFNVEDDLLFIGHDFLYFLWDNEEKIKKWMARKDKYEHWVWCFERIDSIVPAWMHKSHVSLTILSKFCKRILACDEDDCDKYGLDWLPQWASIKFYDNRNVVPTSDKILFSGQAGNAEYELRNKLLSQISEDNQLNNLLQITNTSRSLDWESYINNLLQYKAILNPIGILRGLNTRAYETLYSGRILLQHTVRNYKRHENLLKDTKNVFFFKEYDELKKIINSKDFSIDDSENSYSKNSLFYRMKMIGLDIK